MKKSRKNLEHPTPEKKNRKKPKHLRLIIEIAIVAGVVIAVLCFRFLPWLFSQPVGISDPYAEYQKLFNDVSTYDYSRGPDPALERRIDKAVSNKDTNLVQYYYNLKAKGEYYRRTGRFAVAATALEEALPQAPMLNEYDYLYTSLLACYQAMGDHEQATKYQSILDGTYVVEEETDDNSSDDHADESVENENNIEENTSE